jgi:hypothetical protein
MTIREGVLWVGVMLLASTIYTLALVALLDDDEAMEEIGQFILKVWRRIRDLIIGAIVTAWLAVRDGDD